MITALNVGNNVLSRGFTENIDITPMKLQKIIYFIYRDYLQVTGRELFEEKFETWKYGPVLRSGYDYYKNYGSNAIRKLAVEDDGKTIYIVNEEGSPVFRKIIDSVWGTYKNYDGIYLSSLTHKSGSAWNKAIDRNSDILLDEDIKAEASNNG